MATRPMRSLSVRGLSLGSDPDESRLKKPGFFCWGVAAKVVGQDGSRGRTKGEGGRDSRMRRGARRRPGGPGPGPTTRARRRVRPTGRPGSPTARGSRLRWAPTHAGGTVISELSRAVRMRSGPRTERLHASSRVGLHELARDADAAGRLVRLAEGLVQLGQHLVALRAGEKAGRQRRAADEVDVLRRPSGSQPRLRGSARRRSARTRSTTQTSSPSLTTYLLSTSCAGEESRVSGGSTAARARSKDAPGPGCTGPGPRRRARRRGRARAAAPGQARSRGARTGT